jgi:hypothetical protein
MRTQYAGNGVSIAILDIGIDCAHAKAGGGGFPNAKVIGGYNFAANDTNPKDDNGHGTSVAGIAGGDIDSTGDYIRGVAPGAKLYTVKVADGTGWAYNSTIISCLGWCIAHRDDRATSPMRVINLSMGGSGFTSACDTYSPSMTQAPANAAGAAIAFFASYGNSGYCSMIAFPACNSSTISAGAVFDADLGGLGFGVDPTSLRTRQAGPCRVYPTRRGVGIYHFCRPGSPLLQHGFLPYPPCPLAQRAHRRHGRGLHAYVRRNLRRLPLHCRGSGNPPVGCDCPSGKPALLPCQRGFYPRKPGRSSYQCEG